MLRDSCFLLVLRTPDYAILGRAGPGDGLRGGHDDDGRQGIQRTRGFLPGRS